MAIGAAVRARHMKSLLASVDRLAAGRAAAVRAALGRGRLLVVDEASGVEWLDLELNVALAHALHAALDAREFEAFHRAHFVQALRGPLFRAIHDGVVAIFGRDIGEWARFVPTGWNAIFRDCGRWSVTRGRGGAVELALRRLPRAASADRIWSSSVAASLSALADVAEVDGAVSLVGFDAAGGEAVFELRWTPRALAGGDRAR